MVGLSCYKTDVKKNFSSTIGARPRLTEIVPTRLPPNSINPTRHVPVNLPVSRAPRRTQNSPVRITYGNSGREPGGRG